MKYLFLQEDFSLLRKEYDYLVREHMKLGGDMKEATSQSSETWHDNPLFDDVILRSKLSIERISKLKDIIENSKIVEIDKKLEEVQIGSYVRVLDFGVEKKYKIGSYFILDDQKKDCLEISYDSPVGRALMNKRINDEISFVVNNCEKKLRILEIKI